MTATDTPVEPGVDLERVSSLVIEGVNKGSITWPDLIKAISGQLPTESTKTPGAPPAPQMTPEQKAALNRLPKVFGAVAPETRRVLTDTETTLLYDEKATLDIIEKMIIERKEAIRAAVFNHLDIEAETAKEALPADVQDEEGHVVTPATYRTKEGFYAVKGAVPVAGRDKRFTREVAQGAPALVADKLAALEGMVLVPGTEDNSEVVFTHEDWLAMTDQVRVFNSNKAMEVVKRKPALLAAFARATAAGKRVASFHVR